MTSSLVITPEYPNRDSEIKPQRDKSIPDNEGMRKELLRQILASNVARRMEQTPGAETQQTLAKKAGIGQSHISRILNGAQSVGLDIVAAVSTALGCQPWELLADDEATRRAAMERMLLGPRVTDERAAEKLPPAPKSMIEGDRPKTKVPAKLYRKRRQPGARS